MKTIAIILMFKTLDKMFLLCYCSSMELIIERLKEIQGDQSDEMFAESIGTSRSYWNTIKNGQAEMGLSILKAITLRYSDDKELRGLVNVYLFGVDYSLKGKIKRWLKI